MKQKHFIDIQHIRENATEFKDNNIKCFEPGDIIQISSKVDGANASVAYDKETNTYVAFSRKQELAYDRTLNGFWNYVQNLVANGFSIHNKNWVVFGEWTGARNKVIYSKEFISKKHWIVYDIYDEASEKYLPQSFVKDFCAINGLEYVEVLYEGPFISWEHCKSFLHASKYGDVQEGIVVKNQTKLMDVENRHPAYLKIVNDDFKESMAMKAPEDPSVTEAKAYASSIVESIVTKARVEKAIYKLRDEGVFPEKITPEDMKLVARNLPKYIYDDCVKEENELVKAAGEYFSKMASSRTMNLAREIICS